MFDSLSVRERKLLDAVSEAQIVENLAAARGKLRPYGNSRWRGPCR